MVGMKNDDEDAQTRQAFGLTEAIVLCWTLLWVVGAVGYLVNLYKLVRLCCEIDTWLLVRALGVVLLPLGAIVGFF
jgi:hypothetical protein